MAKAKIEFTRLWDTYVKAILAIVALKNCFSQSIQCSGHDWSFSLELSCQVRSGGVVSRSCVGRPRLGVGAGSLTSVYAPGRCCKDIEHLLSEGNLRHLFRFSNQALVLCSALRQNYANCPAVDRPAVPPNREVQASRIRFLLVLLVAVSRATIGNWFKIITRVYDRPICTSCGEVCPCGQHAQGFKIGAVNFQPKILGHPCCIFSEASRPPCSGFKIPKTSLLGNTSRISRCSTPPQRADHEHYSCSITHNMEYVSP
jgi:hypothetical protein